MHPEKFIFKYNGTFEHINAETLYVSQNYFRKFIQELTSTTLPKHDVKIKVKALPPGSFAMEILLEVGERFGNLGFIAPDPIWNDGLLPILANIIERIKCRKKKESTVKQINASEGGTVNVYEKGASHIENVYQDGASNQKARKAISKMAGTIKSDETISDIELSDTKRGLTQTISREDLQHLDYKKDSSVSEEERFGQELTICTAVFESETAWKFMYENKKIYAKIEDNNFLSNVKLGKVTFSRGKCRFSKNAL